MNTYKFLWSFLRYFHRRYAMKKSNGRGKRLIGGRDVKNVEKRGARAPKSKGKK